MLGKLPRKLITDREEILAEFHPHWKMMLPSIGLAVVAVVVSVLLLATDAGAWRSWVIGLLWVLVAVVAVADFVRRVSTVYVLTSHRLIWRWGVLTRRGLEIPLEQINTVWFSQNIIERALGFGDLEIESASSNGTSKLTNIPRPQEFQSQIYTTRNEAAQRNHRDAYEGAAQAQPASSSSGVGDLERLADLHARGVLSDEQFEAAKAKLLGEL